MRDSPAPAPEQPGFANMAQPKRNPLMIDSTKKANQMIPQQQMQPALGQPQQSDLKPDEVKFQEPANPVSDTRGFGSLGNRQSASFE